MRSQDLLSIVITFVVGIVAGVYLFLSEAAPLLDKIDAEATEVSVKLTIVGDVYGGCRDTCPSFRITRDGSYRYFYTPGVGQEQVLREGVLPRHFWNRIKGELTAPALTAQSKEIQPSVCNSYTDGIDVLYDITIGDDNYYVDSCGTAVDSDSSLWSTLGEIWTYFETNGNNL